MYHKMDQELHPGCPEGARTLQQVMACMRFEDSKLAAVMREIAPGKSEKGISTRTLGHWLGTKRAPFELHVEGGTDTGLVDGAGKPRLYRFASRLVHDNTNVWWVEEFGPKVSGG